MKYTVCEALMWRVLTPTLLKWLREQGTGLDVTSLKREAKAVYRQMTARTPDIGSLKENSLRICLSAGMVWLSVYEAAQEKMSEDCFAGMVRASMETPLVKASFAKKKPFTLEAQTRRAEAAKRANALSDSPFNWNAEVILGRDADEYTIMYRRCGLCALGRQEGLFHLVPHMCVIDTVTTEWMGGVLFRTKTLAADDDCCDFYMCRKGSRWEEERTGRAKE